jgi:HEAT repeat protein
MILQIAAFLFVVANWSLADSPPAPDRIYGGKTLAEWRQLIKSEPASALADRAIVHGLMEIVADPSATWADRRNFALTLGRIGTPASDAVPLLQRLLNSGEEDAGSTRLWALKSLALMGTPASAATADVAAIAEDREEAFMVRAIALETLARIGNHDPLSLATLIEVLQEDRHSQNPREADEIRRAAVEALSLLGPAAAPATPELLRALSSEWTLLQLSAASALGNLGSRGELAIPALVDQILFETDPVVREASADALGRIGLRSLPALKQLMQDPDASVRRLAIRALSADANEPSIRAALLGGLRDQETGNRMAAAAALFQGERIEPEVWEVLLAGLESDQRAVRILAYRTLQKRPAALGQYRQRLVELSRNSSAPAQSQEAARRLLELDPQ